MRLGGYSNTNGITLFCDVLKVKATRKQNDKIDYKLEWILPPRWLRSLGKNKYLSILMILYYQWRAFDLKLKLLVLISLVLTFLEEVLGIPIFDYLVPEYQKEWWHKFVLIAMVAFFIPKITRLLRYHGAEHKVINCYTKHGYANTDLAKASPRFNKRCGTNLVVVFMLLYGILWFFNINSLTLTVTVFLIALILVKKIAEGSSKNTDKYFNFMQFFTVWEPRDKELEVAIKALSLLQESHYLYQKELLKNQS